MRETMDPLHDVTLGDETIRPGEPSANATRADFPPDPPHYQLSELLGRGGMGRVYRARDLRLNREVAVKFLHHGDFVIRERFVREAKALAKPAHPNLCAIYEFGEVAGLPYLVMPLIPGKTLTQARAELSYRDMTVLMLQVAEALHQAHRLGMLHRDLKPGNIMVQQLNDGRLEPMVLDFGIARLQSETELTRTGDVLGTPGYMAPEQARGEISQQDARVDVYGMGATLYFLLTGQAPFQGATPEAVVAALQDRDPVRPRLLDAKVPRDLETIVLKCLAKEPERRYDSALALAEDLGRFLDGSPIEAHPPSLSYRLRRRLFRYRVPVALASSALLLLIGSLVWGEWRANRRALLTGLFSEKVAEIENLGRLSHLSPRHDIRRERLRLAALLDALAAETAAGGVRAAGPGRQALGWGVLTLGRPDEALAHFESAWDTGYRTPRLRYGLGLAHALRYRQLTAAGAGLPGRSAALDAEAEQARERALSFIRDQGVQRIFGSSAYLQALIAFCEGRFAEAEQGVTGLIAEEPWFYEAEQLRGDILHRWAYALSREGREDQARQTFQRALAAHATARSIGQSDPATYHHEVKTLLSIMTWRQFEAAEIQAELERGLTVLDWAEQVLPEDPELDRLRARLHYRHAVALRNARRDPLLSLQQGLAALDRLGIHPARQAELDRLRGTLLWLWAQWLRGQNQPAGHLEDHAVAVLERIPEDHRTYAGLVSLGAAYRGMGRSLARRGRAAGPVFTCSAENYAAALARDPHGIEAAAGLGQVLYHLAGQEPLPRALDHLQRAHVVLDQAVTRHPQNVALHYQLGRVLLRMAEGGRAGGDTVDVPLLEAGIQRMETALSLNPRIRQCYRGVAVGWIQRANDAWRNGEPYDDFLGRAVSVCDRGLAQVTRAVSLRHIKATALYWQGKFRVREGRDPREPFDEVADLLAEPRNDHERLTLGSMLRLRAEHAARQGRFVEAEFDQARTLFETLLRNNPNHGEAARSLARLWTTEARRRKANGMDVRPAAQMAEKALAQAEALVGTSVYDLARARLLLVQEETSGPRYIRLLTDLAARPDSPEAVIARACLLAGHGADPDAARSLRDQALARNPRLAKDWGVLFDEQP